MPIIRTYDELLSLVIELRNAHELSQREVAERLGVRQSTVGNWEAEASQISVPAVGLRTFRLCRRCDR